MVTRRQFLSRGGLGMLGLSGAALAFPGDAGEPSEPGALPDGSASKGMFTPQAESAIQNGLRYLASHQQGGAFGTRNYHGNVAVTSLGALAFMAAGNQPNRGKYGKLVTDSLRYVLSFSQQNGPTVGYLYNPRATPHGPMYGHGFGTLFLGECHGQVHDRALREELTTKLRQALQLIVRSQNSEGGWRYHPHTREADLSVTVCQIMALRSGRNAGFAVPKACVKRCVAYVKRCQDPMRGFFRYMPRGGGPQDAFARTGAGLAALFSAGVYSGPEIDRGLKFLETCKPDRRPGVFGADMQYFYGHYYAAQAMWTAGGHWWTEWFPAVREELLRHQNPDGSWDDRIDRHYATAMACIILQVPNNYLPIMQK
jgi:Prenyltransferase and squalene oxidase repeat